MKNKSVKKSKRLKIKEISFAFILKTKVAARLSTCFRLTTITKSQKIPFYRCHEI